MFNEKNKFNQGNCLKPLCPIINYCLIGPTGPMGPQGPAKIDIVKTVTLSPDDDAKIVNIGTDNNLKLEIYIPKGEKGEQGPEGPMGPKGDQGEIGPVGEMGPMGPKGEMGEAETITIGSVTTGDAGSEVIITDHKFGLNHVLDFVIPRGEAGLNGKDGKDGAEGSEGPMGPMGPPGLPGTSVTILGSYDSVQDLNREHSSGKPGDSYLVDDSLYVWDDEDKEWRDVGVIRGPRGLEGPMGPPGRDGEPGLPGPRGDIGPTGPPGPLEIPTGYFVTYNNNLPNDNLPVLSGQRIPIEVKAADNAGYFNLDMKENTISFETPGIYRVSFIVSAKTNNPLFDENTSIVSIGFKKENDDTVYVGGSIFDKQNIPAPVVGQGMIVVASSDEKWELANLGKNTIYLSSPKIENTISNSYYINAIVSILIQFVG